MMQLCYTLHSKRFFPISQRVAHGKFSRAFFLSCFLRCSRRFCGELRRFAEIRISVWKQHLSFAEICGKRQNFRKKIKKSANNTKTEIKFSAREISYVGVHRLSLALAHMHASAHLRRESLLSASLPSGEPGA